MAKPTPAQTADSKRKFVLDFDLTKLTHHPDNPRTISREGRRALAASIEKWDMLETIVANKRADGTYVVLGGHQRLDVLVDRGDTKGLVAVVQVDELTEKQIMVALNGHHGKWDGEKLSTLLEEFIANNVETDVLGLEGVPSFEAQLATLAVAAEFEDRNGGGTGGPQEVDVDDLQLKHRCPKCGFEFDKETTTDGRRTATKAKQGQGRKAGTNEEAQDDFGEDEDSDD